MTENEAWGQAFENGRKVGDAEGYARGKAEAVKPGRWIDLEPEIGLFACSECDHRILRAKCNYCPNCGARMDGDGDG